MAKQSPQYPLWAYPLEVSNAIWELQKNVKAPMALIGTTVLTALAAAAQGRVKVKLPIGANSRSIAIFAVILGVSGERKTTTESHVMKPFHARDAALQKSFKTKLRRFEIDNKLWTKINDHLINDIVKATQDGDSTEERYEQLLEHETTKPNKPARPGLILQNSSQRAVLNAIDGHGKSVALFTDEGDSVLNSPLFESLGLLNKGWDGGPVYYDRANGVNIAAHDIRFSFSILVQNKIFDAYKKRKGDLLRGSGLFARCLFTAPPSEMGHRFETDQESTWQFLPKLHSLIARELDCIPEDGQVCESEQIVYELDKEAKSYWIELVNRTEVQLQPHGNLQEISDFASKACEIAVRIAAILHHYSEQTGKISRDSLDRAAAIVGFHIDEFKRVMSEPSAYESANDDAQKLWNYLFGKHFAYQNLSVPKNILLQYGPIRNKAQLQCAIDVLVYSKQIWIGRDQTGRTWVNYMQPTTPALGY